MSILIPSDYYNTVAQIESGGNPNAVSSSSSASGLFGIIGSTSKALGGNGLAQMETLTQQNAQALVSNGFDVTAQNLYTLHFLGQGQGLNVLSADNSTPLSALVSGAAINSNPQLKGMTAGDFTNYTANLVGGNAPSSGSGPSNGQLAGQAAGEAGQFATDIASGNYVDAVSNGVQDILGAFGIGSRTPGGNSSSSTSSSGSIFSWLTDFFSAHTATRFAFVVIGIILVGIAIVYLAAQSDAGKVVVNNVKETAKTVASTAVVAAAA